MTEFELFHRKQSGDIVTIEENDRMRWGKALEEAIANEVAKDNNLVIRRMNEYIYDDETRTGSSFDFAIGEDGILEVKNVDSLAFRDSWLEHDDGNIEAPLWIEIQVQVELMMSERKHCLLAALVGGNRLVLIKRDRNEAVIASIKAKIAEFWASIESNTPPKPNFSKDAEFIASLYRYAEPNKVFDARGNESFIELAREHKRLKQIIKESDEQCDGLKAQMLMVIGDAEKVEGGEFSISLGMVADNVKMITDLTPAQLAGEEPVSKRAGYRNFRVTFRKVK
jgi:predicted phage-related endonuclease